MLFVYAEKKVQEEWKYERGAGVMVSRSSLKSKPLVPALRSSAKGVAVGIKLTWVQYMEHILMDGGKGGS